MPHEENQSQPNPNVNFEISQPKEGITRVYANYSHLSWSGVDLTVQLYQLEQPNREVPANKDVPNRLLNNAAVTLSWAAAKMFHKNLTDALARYEKAYGPIVTEFKEI